MSIVEKTNLPPSVVWQGWTQAHATRSSSTLESGATGFMEGSGKKIAYQIIDVTDGRSFSILWKGWGVRFVFEHQVVPSFRGSEVHYDCQIRGVCGWMVRWFLLAKIRTNLRQVLKAFLQKLEAENGKNARHR